MERIQTKSPSYNKTDVLKLKYFLDTQRAYVTVSVRDINC